MTEQTSLSTARRRVELSIARESHFMFKRLFHSGCALAHVSGAMVERSLRPLASHTGGLGTPRGILDIEVSLDGPQADVDELVEHLVLKLCEDPHLLSAHEIWLYYTRVVLISRKVREGIYPYRVGTPVRVLGGYVSWRSQAPLDNTFLSIHARQGIVQDYPTWREGKERCALVRAGEGYIGNVPIQFLERLA